VRYSIWATLAALLAAAPLEAQVRLTAADAPRGLEAAWQAFLLEPFHRAFAVGPNGRHAAVVGGDSEAAAIAEALASCGEGCRVIAVGDRLDDQPRPEPARTALGPFLSDPDYPLRGPAAAAGVMVWTHGSGPDPSQIAQYPDPWARHVFAAGFDILRFDRERAQNALDRGSADFAAGLSAARAHGYRRVIAAGHSRGAWLALLAARASRLDGVIAIAPAIHGTNRPGNSRFELALPEWQALVAGLPAGLPLALVTFAGDPFDAGPDRRAQIAREHHRGPVAALVAPDGVEGHGGGMEPVFARRYGACLAAFAGGGWC
jgi:hypothetical protein